MMNLPEDMSVTLVIKAPNQRMEDQTVDCMLGWTIKKLKEHLETVYPSKPKHNEQRLIYSGRLLQDHLTLKEILRQYDDSELPKRHTVHLVCSTSKDYGSSPSAQDSSKDAKSSSAPKDRPLSSQTLPARSTNQAVVMDGLRHRGQGQPSTPNCSGTSSTTYPMYQPDVTGSGMMGAYAGYPYTSEQYAWMMQQQQMYMLQYMQYYQSFYYQGQSFNPQSPSPSPFLQQPAGLGANLHPQQQPQPPPQVAANNDPGAARANVRMNAQGGMEEDDDDEGEPRDWLHHTYFFMRFLTFMGILFFYSNLTRFLIVFTGSLAIYILQRVRKLMQRAQREQNQQHNQDQQNEPEQQQDDNQPHQEQQQEQANANGTEENADGSLLAGSETEARDQQQRQDQDEGSRGARVFAFMFNTIQTFFTSLLPTPPELLEPN